MRKKRIALLTIAVSAVVVFLTFLGKFNERDKTSWTGALNQAVAGADRLVVRKPPVAGSRTETVSELRGAQQVREMFALIDVDPKGSGFHCMCDGEYWIQSRTTATR